MSSLLRIYTCCLRPAVLSTRHPLVTADLTRQHWKEYLERTYKERCTICRLDNSELLRASHIIPHSANDDTTRRMDNSILLCSLHDSLFDQGLITMSYEAREYHIQLSSAIMKSDTPFLVRIHEDLSRATFHPLIEHPPSESSLTYHNRYVFLDGEGNSRKWRQDTAEEELWFQKRERK